MTKPEELIGQAECKQGAPSSVSDLCKTEYWNARSLWQSDLDFFAAQGITGTADEILAANENASERPAQTEAEDFLRDILRHGPLPARDALRARPKRRALRGAP